MQIEYRFRISPTPRMLATPQVRPHHQILVSRASVSEAGGKQAQLSRALNCRRAIARIELCVNVAYVRVDCVHREVELAGDLRPGKICGQKTQHAKFRSGEFLQRRHNWSISHLSKRTLHHIENVDKQRRVRCLIARQVFQQIP